MPIIKPDELLPSILDNCFDRITKNLSPSVGGLYVAVEEKLVEHVASCIFIRFKGREYIVTATHVLKRFPEALIVGYGGRAGSFGGEFKFAQDEDQLDIAIARMPDKLRSKLPDVQFYDIGHCERQSPNWTPNRCVIFGMPNTKNRRKPGEDVPQTRGVYGFMTGPSKQQTVPGKPKISGRTHIVLDWDARNVVKAGGDRWNPPDLVGTSGGAIINLGHLENEDVFATLVPPMPTIEGVVSLWVDKKWVVGVRFSAMIAGLNKARAWPV